HQYLSRLPTGRPGILTSWKKPWSELAPSPRDFPPLLGERAGVRAVVPVHRTSRSGLTRGAESGCLSPERSSTLSQKFRDDLARHIRKPKVAALKTIGQLRVIESEQVQNRRVQVVDMHFVLRRVETKFV